MIKKQWKHFWYLMKSPQMPAERKEKISTGSSRFEKWLYSPGNSGPKVIVKGVLCLIVLLGLVWIFILYAPTPFGAGWGSW